MSYDVMDPDKVEETMTTLSKRINERFPESGLGAVSNQLREIANKTKETAQWISEPDYRIRIFSFIVIAVILVILAGTISQLEMGKQKFGFFDFVEVCEAGINDLILIGAAIFFLITLETRIKRKRVVTAIQRLRSIAHIIDMHQLTKDPESIFAKGKETASSPKREITPFLLNRYLDYCTEMLSLIGKLAALYVQGFGDPISVSAVNDLESLTTDLSRKIWQKIIILNTQAP